MTFPVSSQERTEMSRRGLHEDQEKNGSELASEAHRRVTGENMGARGK